MSADALEFPSDSADDQNVPAVTTQEAKTRLDSARAVLGALDTLLGYREDWAEPLAWLLEDVKADVDDVGVRLGMKQVDTPRTKAPDANV